MSAKKQKELRRLFRVISEIMDKNEGLYQEGFKWFDFDEDHDEWFHNACQMLALDSDTDKELLMPDMLPHFMYELGIIEDHEIDQLLLKIRPAKMKEITDELKKLEENQLI